jgi:hypothetical protein
MELRADCQLLVAENSSPLVLGLSGLGATLAAKRNDRHLSQYFLLRALDGQSDSISRDCLHI